MTNSQTQLKQLKTKWFMRTCFLVMLSIFSVLTPASAQYCTAGSLACDEWLDQVIMGSINNMPGGTGCSAGYQDYTFMQTDVMIGVSIPITVYNGPNRYNGDAVDVYIDWNQNGIYNDPGEYTLLSTTDNIMFTGNITPPLGAVLGLTGMRIRMRYSFTEFDDPCMFASYGEVEDYTVNVLTAPPCPWPSNLVATNILFTTADLGWDVVTGAVSYNVRYKLTSDPTSVSSWTTPTSVVTNSLSLAGLTDNSAYEFQVETDCGSGGAGFSFSAYFNTLCFPTPGGATVENEVCGTDANGGCNMTIPAYEPLTCGETIAGTSWADLSNRDTDWFVFTLATPGSITWQVNAQFPVLAGFVDASQGCGTPVFFDLQQNAVACGTVTCTSNLPAGTWWAFVAPSVFAGYPCSSGSNNYDATLTCNAAPTPPLNDDCSGAFILTQNTTCVPTTGDVANAFQSLTSCAAGTTANDDVWYSFQAMTSTVVVQVTPSGSFDAVFEVFDACGGASVVCENLFGMGVMESVSIPTNIGNTYYVRVYDAGVGIPLTTNFDICVYDGSTPPANDLCANAIPVICGSSTPGTTINATADGISTLCGTTPSAPGVWYSIIGTGDVITATLCNTIVPWDSKINVYSDGCGILNCVGGNDDSPTCSPLSTFTWTSVLGLEYDIMVNGYTGLTGDFVLDISCIPVPSNDNVCAATSLVIGPNGPFSNVGAGVELGEPVPPASTCNDQLGWCAGGPTIENTVWFTVVAPLSGRLNIDIHDIDSQAAFYDAAYCTDIPNGFAMLRNANDDGSLIATNGSLIIATCLSPGVTYYLQVDGYNGAQGTFNIEVTDPGMDASFTGLPATTCTNGVPVTLTPVESGGTFSGTGVLGNVFDPTVTGSGTFGITYALADGCNSSTQFVTVGDVPVPVITPNGNSDFCVGSSVTLDAGTSDIYGNYTSYMWMPGMEITQTAIAANTGTYDVMVTNTNGCSATAFINVTGPVYALPIPVITPATTLPFCMGGSVVLDAGTGDANGVYTSFSWIPTGEITQTDSAMTTGLYNVMVTNVNGCVDTAQVPIQVTVYDNPVPVITALTGTSFCAGGSVVLDAGTGDVNGLYTTYAWTPNSITTETDTASAAGSYSVTVTNANGCTANAAIPVVVTINANPIPVITPAGPVSFCASNITPLDAGTSDVNGTYTNYSWTPSSAITQTVTPAAGSYTVMVTNTNGCTGTSSPVVVTINTNPTVTLTPFANTICVTDPPFTLTGGSPSGGAYSGPGVSAGMFNPTVATVGTWTIMYLYTDGNSCSGSATQNITVDSASCLTAIYSTVGSSFTDFGLIAFPNPFGTEITLNIQSTDLSPATLQVFDMEGRLLETHLGVLPGNNFNAGSELRSGIYLAQIVQGTRSTFIKIVKAE